MPEDFADFSERAGMATIHDSDAHSLYRLIREQGGSMIDGIRAVRGRHGLSLAQAKEVALQADGVADSLDAHSRALAPALLAALDDLEADRDEST